MANLGDWAQFLLAIVPVINLIVALIEQLFASSTGGVKKAMAMEVARSYLPVGPGNVPVPDEVLSRAIDSQVELYNISGAFNHKRSSEVPGSLAL